MRSLIYFLVLTLLLGPYLLFFQSKLSANSRLGLAYKNLEKVSEEKIEAIKISSENFLIKMVNGEKV